MQTDFKMLLSKYKDSIKQISTSGNGIASLDQLSVKLTSSKKPAALNDVGTLNIIDPLKVELTTFDPQVIYFIHIFY